LRNVRLFRSKTQIPTFRLGPLLIVVAACLVVVGLAALAVLEPRPPIRHFEVPVPSERFAR
jgi:hypothetical protein